MAGLMDFGSEADGSSEDEVRELEARLAEGLEEAELCWLFFTAALRSYKRDFLPEAIPACWVEVRRWQGLGEATKAGFQSSTLNKAAAKDSHTRAQTTSPLATQAA